MANMKLPKMGVAAKARKDINFFALRKVKRSAMDITIPPWVWSIAIPSIVVAVIVSVYAYNQSTISRLQKELATSELQIENANVDKQRPYMAQKTVEKEIFSTYYSWISNLNGQFEYYKNVQSEIPDSITATATDLVHINSFSASAGNISISGTSGSMTNIAEFQRRCMDIPDIKTAFVSNMSRVDNKQYYQEEIPKEEAVDPDEIYSFNFTATFNSKNNMMEGESE